MGSMSLLQFIASDEPLKNVENPYIKWISINQAIKNGYKVREELLENPKLDKDDEKMLMFCDSMEHFEELEIIKQETSRYTEQYTKKKYCSEITWRYTDKRAKQLLEYIHNHLKGSNEIELWRIWMDDNSTPTIYKVVEEELRLKHIKKIFKQDGFNIPECVIITKGK